jgi:hypothetical protein
MFLEVMVPFRSKSQQRLLFLKHPKVAEQFASETPKSAYSKLPEHASKDKNRLKEYTKKHRRKKDVI